MKPIINTLALAFGLWLWLAGPLSPATLTMETAGGQNFTTASSWVVLTGQASETVKINGSANGITWDAARAGAIWVRSAKASTSSRSRRPAPPRPRA